MGETLTQQRRVSDEDLRVVKLCQVGKNTSGQYPEGLMVPLEEAPANSVPAAAKYGGCKRCSDLLGVKSV